MKNKKGLYLICAAIGLVLAVIDLVAGGGAHVSTWLCVSFIVLCLYWLQLNRESQRRDREQSKDDADRE